MPKNFPVKFHSAAYSLDTSDNSNIIKILIVDGEAFYMHQKSPPKDALDNTWLYFQGFHLSQQKSTLSFVGKTKTQLKPITAKKLMSDVSQRLELAERGKNIPFVVGVKRPANENDAVCELIQRMGRPLQLKCAAIGALPMHKLIQFMDLDKAIVSCALGGGFWNTIKGRKLSHFLRHEYPNNFGALAQISKLSQKRSDTNCQRFTSPEALNLWLIKYCDDKSAIGDKNYIPMTTTDDTYIYQNNEFRCDLL